MKKVLITILSLVLFCGLLLFVLPYTLNLEKIRDVVVRQLEERVHGDIEVGDITWVWLPLPSLELKDVRLDIGPVDCDLPAAVLTPDLWGLVTGNPDLSYITLRDPVLYVRKTGNKGKTAFLEKGLPPISLEIQNGKLIMDLPDDWAQRLHMKDLTVSEINLDVELTAPEVVVSGECSSTFYKSLYLKGRYNLDGGGYEAELTFRELYPHQFLVGILKGESIRPLESSVDLQVQIEGKDLETFEASLKGELPCVRIKPKEKEILLSCGSASLSMTRDPDHFSVNIERLELKDPELVLTGEFARSRGEDGVPPQWHVDLHGSRVDLGAVRHKLLALWPDNHVVKTVCSIVLGGTAQEASFSLDGPVDSFTHLEAMSIKAVMENGRIHVPEADLLLDQVNGDVEIAGGILTCTNLKGRMGNSRALDGSLVLGLHGGDAPFVLDIDLDADLKQLPPILQRLVHDPDFKGELARFSEVEGRARGRLHLGERLHSIEVSVDIQEMQGKALYERLPWPVEIHGGKLLVVPDRVSWKGLKADVGPHEISSMDGEVDWSGDVTLALSEVEAEIASGPLFQYLTSFEKLRDLLSPEVTWMHGRFRLAQGSFEGILHEPSGWVYSLDVRPLSLFFQSPLLFGPLHAKGGKVHITREQVRMTDLVLLSDGHELRLNSLLHHTRWQDWHGVMRLDGEVGTEAAGWIKEKGWIPQEYFPRIPVDLIDLQVAWDESSVKVQGSIYPVDVESDGIGADMDIRYDKKGLHISKLQINSPMELATLSLEVDKKLGTTGRWKGTVSGDTLDQLLENNQILKGELRGDFAWHFEPDRPGTMDFKGGLSAREFFWMWGMESHPLHVERLEVKGKGSSLRLEDVVFGLNAREHLEVKGTIGAGDGADEMFLDLDVSSEYVSFRHLRASFLGAGQGEGPQEKDARAGKETGKTRIRLSGRIAFVFKEFVYVHPGTDEKGEKKGTAYVWHPLKGRLRLSPDGRRELLVDQGDLCDLQTTGEWVMEPSDPRGHGDLSVTTPFDSVIRLEDVLACMGMDQDMISGPFFLDLELKSRSGVWKDGFVRIRASDGRIKRATLIAKIFSVINVFDLFVGGVPDLFTEGFAYSELVITGKVRDNVFKIEKAYVKGQGINLFGSGELDLSTYELDATVLVAPLKTVDVVLEKIPVVGRVVGGKHKTMITIPVGVSGPVKDPSVIILQPDKVGGAILNWVRDTIKLPFELIGPMFKGGEEEPAEKDQQEENQSEKQKVE